MREADALACRHARYYADLAQRWENTGHETHQATTLLHLNDERENLRAALRWTRTHGERELACSLAVALMAIWRLNGRAAEAGRWLDDAFDACENADGDARMPTPRAVRARVGPMGESALMATLEPAERPGALDGESVEFSGAFGDSWNLA